MTLTVDLTTEEEARLAAAAHERGVAADERLRQLITECLPAPEDRTLELFAQWEAEDATDDPAELASRNQEWEEFRESMNATRRQAGARILFP